MLLEKNPNLAAKNKKGQTAIDMANNKLMISLISHFLSRNPEEAKQAKAEIKSNRQAKLKVETDKIQLKSPEIPQGIDSKQKEKAKIMQRPKKHLEVILHQKEFVG